MFSIFRLLAGVISIYTLLCFIRIMLTWFPGAQYSTFGRILCQICDPYLNLFRNLTWFRFSMFDFTPAIALCVLMAASTVCSSLAATGRFSIGGLLSLAITMIWSVISSLIFFAIILLVVRLVVLLTRRDQGTYGGIWEQLDRSISHIIFGISGFFSKRPMPYKNALIISTVTLIVIWVAGRYLIAMLATILNSLGI